MRNESRVGVVIPALNEEKSIGRVLSAMPDWVDEVVVADNGSWDRTAEIARKHGAHVVLEPRRGYGAACLAGIAQLTHPDIVLFMDGDFSDYPEESAALVDPIAADQADMVIGSRVRGHREAGALTPQARFGNWLACLLILRFWKVDFTDLGPFRAVGYDALLSLHMRDLDYGWTVEMQIKAAQAGLRVWEVPVSYRARIGKSKVSGTVRGIMGAGTKILWTIFKAAAGGMPDTTGHSSAERVIVFTRYPQPGMVKTRLAPTLGDEGAAALHAVMTEHIIRRVRDLYSTRHAVLEVRYDGGSRIAMSRWLGHGIDFREQKGSDLGERMTLAFRDAFEHGSTRVLLIGSDCPGITRALLEHGLDALHDHDVVFGPAADGGYYLVGMKQTHASLFSGVTWGTSDVLQRTLDRARELKLSTFLLTRLRDVDRPEDLIVWHSANDAEDRTLEKTLSRGQRATNFFDPGTATRTDAESRPEFPGLGSFLGPSVVDRSWVPRGKISVIIPTLNEAQTLPAALASVGQSDDVEILVVDGGSTDNTVLLAQSLGAKAIRSQKGRAAQMNRGAAEANGDILLFLHADTRLPALWADYVRRELAYPRVSGGAFRFRTDSHQWGLRAIERLANFRAGWFQMPYGDQALFVRADVFRQVRGFPDLPVMEDFEFVRRLRREGRVIVTHATALTSSRRWDQSGIWQTSVRNQVIIVGYLLGISPERLARVRDHGQARDS